MVWDLFDPKINDNWPQPSGDSSIYLRKLPPPWLRSYGNDDLDVYQQD